MNGRLGGAVVTGGSTGIGLACARGLATAGFDVMIAGRREAALEAARAAISESLPARSILARTTDVADPQECEWLIAEAAARLQSLDVLVNAAAICAPSHALEMTAADWDRTFNINARGSALCSVAAARHMREATGGRIVLFSSINGVTSEPSSADYSATKAAVASLARSLAVDLAQFGIAVNAVAPGWVDTPMIADFVEEADPASFARLNPMGRLGHPEEIANVVTYLAKDAPLFLTGSTLFVDGGQTAAAPLP